MESKRIYLSCPTMHEWEKKYVDEAFASNWIAPVGPHVNAFEKEITDYVGVQHAAALSSGTAAIHLAVKLLGIGVGDVVFCSSLTFAASCNPIRYENATPVFIDSEPDTWNMSPRALEKAFEKYPNPKAVICVHLYGNPAKLDEIMAICKKHNVPMIEDAAESLSATYKGKQTGTFGKFGIFSFNGNKIITTSSGGMLVSDDQEAIEKARFLATQARDAARYYQHSQLGYNYRLSNVDAGIGRGQLKSLDLHRKLKQDIYRTYREAFADIPEIAMNPLNPDGESNCWLSCMTIEEGAGVTPNQIMDALEAENIESRPIWKPMNLQPVYADCDFFSHNEEGQISVGEDIFNRGVCLPSDVKNTKEDMERIIRIVRGVFGR